MTAHVAHGLKIASNTVNVPEGMISGAVRWLKNYQERQTALLEQGDKFRKLEQLPDGPEKKEALRKLGNYRLTASATDTLVYSVLAECGVKTCLWNATCSVTGWNFPSSARFNWRKSCWTPTAWTTSTR